MRSNFIRSLAAIVAAAFVPVGAVPSVVEASTSGPLAPTFHSGSYGYLGPWPWLDEDLLLSDQYGTGGRRNPGEAFGNWPARPFVLRGEDTAWAGPSRGIETGANPETFDDSGWVVPAGTQPIWVDHFPDGGPLTWSHTGYIREPRSFYQGSLARWSPTGDLLWEVPHDDVRSIAASDDGSAYVLAQYEPGRYGHKTLTRYDAHGVKDWTTTIAQYEDGPCKGPGTTIQGMCDQGGAALFADGVVAAPDGSVVVSVTTPDFLPGCEGLDEQTRRSMGIASPERVRVAFEQDPGSEELTVVDVAETTARLPIAYHDGVSCPNTTMIARFSADGELQSAWPALGTAGLQIASVTVLTDNRVALVRQAYGDTVMGTSGGWVGRTSVDPTVASTLTVFTPDGEQLEWSVQLDSVRGSFALAPANNGGVLLASQVADEGTYRSAISRGPVRVVSEYPKVSIYASLMNVAANYDPTGALQWLTPIGQYHGAQMRLLPRGDNEADLIRYFSNGHWNWQIIRSVPPTPPPPPPERSWGDWLVERYRGNFETAFLHGVGNFNAWWEWLTSSGLDLEAPPDWLEALFDPSAPVPPVDGALLESMLTRHKESLAGQYEGEQAGTASGTASRWMCLPSTDQPFVDVAARSDSGRAVACLHHLGIANGTGGGRFTPQRAITRAEMATFLWRIAGKPTPTKANPFIDVPNNATYAPAVRWLAENGITTSAASGRFKPSDIVTRGQMASFLWAFVGRPAALANSFRDVPSTQWFTAAVDWLAQRGIARGMNGGTVYKPYDPVTREHMALFLNRLGTTYRIWTT